MQRKSKREFCRLILALALALVAFDVYADVCNDDTISLHLDAQHQYVKGDPTKLVKQLSELENDPLSLEGIDTELIPACNDMFFATVDNSAMLFSLGEWVKLEQGTPQERLDAIVAGMRIQNRYDEVLQQHENVFPSGGRTVRSISRLMTEIASQLDVLISAQPDRIILPISKSLPDNEPTYRVITKDRRDILVFEFLVSNGEILFDRSTIRTRGTFMSESDALEVPRSSAGRWRNWADEAEVRIVAGDRYSLRMSGYLFPIEFRQGSSHAIRELAVTEVFRLLSVFISPIPYKPPQSHASGSAATNGTCILYKSPGDNDLFAYSSPSPSAIRERLSVQQESMPIAKLSLPFSAIEDDNELISPHLDEEVTQWIEVAVRGRSAYVVYQKRLRDGRMYNRFREVECQ